MPISKTDYNLMVASSSSFALTGASDFPTIISTTGDFKFIRGKDDMIYPWNYFAYQSVFSLQGHRNYSCLRLPIYLRVTNYNIEAIKINGIAIAKQILAASSAKQICVPQQASWRRSLLKRSVFNASQRARCLRVRAPRATWTIIGSRSINLVYNHRQC
jgi:hypothetical protein